MVYFARRAKAALRPEVAAADLNCGQKCPTKGHGVRQRRKNWRGYSALGGRCLPFVRVAGPGYRYSGRDSVGACNAEGWQGGSGPPMGGIQRRHSVTGGEVATKVPV